MKILSSLKKLLAWRNSAEAVSAKAATPSLHPALLRAADPDRVNLRVGVVAARQYPVCLVSPARADDNFIVAQIKAFVVRCSHRPGADILTALEGAISRFEYAPRYLKRRILLVSATPIPHDDIRLTALGEAAKNAGAALHLVLLGNHDNLGYLSALNAETRTATNSAPEATAAIRATMPAAVETVMLTVVLDASSAMRADFGGRTCSSIVADAIIHALPRRTKSAAIPEKTQLQAA